jgi:hypothetical protein
LSLPGAGPALPPRLLASLGTDRRRFPDALSVHGHSGIAPVTEKSGKSQWVHLRWNGPKFLRQTWHEFAGCSIKYSAWARACYDALKQRMSHQEALRKLAYKWQRIVWRRWQEGQPYDEARYLGSLQNAGCPFMPTSRSRPRPPVNNKRTNPLTDHLQMSGLSDAIPLGIVGISRPKMWVNDKGGKPRYGSSPETSRQPV